MFEILGLVGPLEKNLTFSNPLYQNICTVRFNWEFSFTCLNEILFTENLQKLAENFLTIPWKFGSGLSLQVFTEMAFIWYSIDFPKIIQRFILVNLFLTDYSERFKLQIHTSISHTDPILFDTEAWIFCSMEFTIDW